METGAQCVMMDGTQQMPTWLVDSLATLALVCKEEQSLFVILGRLLFLFICTDSTAYYSAHFGQNSAVIIALDNVACTVYEPRLIDCPYDSNVADCTHSEDAGVQCVPRELHSHRYNTQHLPAAITCVLHSMFSWQHQTEKWFHQQQWEGGAVSEWRLGDSV